MGKTGRKLTSLLFISSLLVTAVGCGGGQGNETAAQPEGNKDTVASNGIQERKIKLGIGLNEDHPEAFGARKFKEIVEEKTAGKIKVDLFYSNTLGDDQKMAEALKGGLQELTVISTSPLAPTVKEFGIFDFPFVFNTGEEADAVLDGPVGQAVLDKLPEQGWIGLAYWENGFRNLTNSKHPVEKLEDFAGLKIRTMQNQVHLDVFKALGANPTPMAFSELFTAMESKAIDGQENPFPTIESNKFNEVQTYLSVTNHVYTPFIFLAGKPFWDKLSDEEKQILQEAAKEAGKVERQLNREQSIKSLENLKAAGMKVNEVAAEEKARIQEAIKPVIDKYSKELGEDLVKQMYEEVEKLRNK